MSKYNLILSWLIATIAICPFRAEAASESHAPKDGSVSQRFVLTPPADSGVRSIEVRAATTETIDEAFQQSLTEVTDSSPIRAVTVIQPEQRHVVPEKYFSESQALAGQITSSVRQVVKISSRSFAEWFNENRVRLTIISFQFTLMSGLKFTEFVISPQPVEHAPALAAALVMGGLLGAVEWNSARLIEFIVTPGALVKRMLERLTEGATATSRSKKVGEILGSAWQFTKNSYINFILFGVFKIVLFASVQADGSVPERILEALQSVTGAEIATWTQWAVAATAVSFPTTKLIMNSHSDGVSKAAGDPTKLAQIRDRTVFYSASALTIRALLFSSVILAEAVGWPGLSVAAYSGLGLMFGGSVWKLWSDAKRPGLNHCAAAFQ